MALHAAKDAGIEVPDECLAQTMEYLDTVQPDKTIGLFCYQPREAVNATMTAAGILSCQYSGWESDNPAMLGGIDQMVRRYRPRAEQPNMYYWYYATQVMHNVGGNRWDEWNQQFGELLIQQQVDQGHAAGSWTPEAQYDVAGGRLYMTALACCTLEIYYRYLPLYEHYTSPGAKRRREVAASFE